MDATHRSARLRKRYGSTVAVDDLDAPLREVGALLVAAWLIQRRDA